jgi:hypothetical protein
MKSDLESLGRSLTARSDFDSFRTTTQAELLALKEASATKAELTSLREAAAMKTELHSLREAAATKTELNSFREAAAMKTELNSLREAAAMKTELKSLREAAAMKTELNSLREAAATKVDLNGLKATSVSKTELNSMKSGWAAQSALDVLKRESATKTELSDIRNRLEPLVADADRLKRGAGQSFPMNAYGSLDGIIASLTRRFGGNVHDRGIVTISASSLLGERWAGRNAADLDSQSPDSIFASAADSNAWLLYDFKALRVRLSHYTVRSAEGHFPKSWVIEGSLDASLWTQLDQRMHTNDLNERYRVGTFPVSAVAEARFIRFRLIETNHDAHWYRRQS